MNNSCCSRSDLTVGMDMCHHVVSPPLLFLGGDLELVILDRCVGSHLLDCFV